ncbi:hypothetical protein XNA1_2900018 [Xenorhabdus nematophila str. Anatoliense]|nr:hypothetical protein XNA1_2900018 [Xenorhabdus nematophila str. Anatoliense]
MKTPCKENVVYVATDKQYPVTMFITEKGSEAQALSLTMVPRRIGNRVSLMSKQSDLCSERLPLAKSLRVTR